MNCPHCNSLLDLKVSDQYGQLYACDHCEFTYTIECDNKNIILYNMYKFSDCIVFIEHGRTIIQPLPGCVQYILNIVLPFSKFDTQEKRKKLSMLI